VGGGFLLAGRADSGVAGLGPEVGQGGCAEVAHAGLDAPDQLAQELIQILRHFLERLDALGGNLAVGILWRVAVAGGGAGFHRGQAAHAAVLFVEFAADLHHLAGCLGAAGEQPAADHAVG
ncbi:uncharacterized protein METZ01_LOCUS110413, partial [marine metagenome]